MLVVDGLGYRCYLRAAFVWAAGLRPSSFEMFSELTPRWPIAFAMSWVPTILAANPAIDIDGTVFIQAGVFFTLLLILKPLLFDPWLAAQERRSSSIDGALAASKKLRGEVEAMQQEHALKLAQAKEKAVVVRSQARSEAEAQSVRTLGDSRSAAQAHLDGSRKSAQQSAQTARASLSADVDALASEVVLKVLGRAV